MIKLKDTSCICFVIINIIFLIYYSIQLLFFTDEFALQNIGFFNHAVAGLSEIIGIIFLCLSIGLFISIFNEPKQQTPLLVSILLIETIITLNFLRYVITNSPGETNIQTITMNGFIFFFMSLTTLCLILKIKMIK